MFFRLLALSSVLILTSCAYALETQTQEIQFETPGAENALCHVYVDKLKYKVRPPQSIIISKSPWDMTVDCMAPGNRRKEIVIKPTASKYALREAPLILPLAWDLVSTSAYKYPDVVTVDFTYTPVKPEELPAQNRPDVKQPEEYPLEEILPGRPRLNSDKYETPIELQRRQKAEPVGLSPYMVEETVTTTDKGDLKSVAPSAVNPAGPPSLMTSPEPESSGPSYPGQ